MMKQRTQGTELPGRNPYRIDHLNASRIGFAVIEMSTSPILRLVSTHMATYCNSYGKSAGGEAVPSSERNL
jgi:hypothetical protein